MVQQLNSAWTKALLDATEGLWYLGHEQTSRPENGGFGVAKSASFLKMEKKAQPKYTIHDTYCVYIIYHHFVLHTLISNFSDK